MQGSGSPCSLGEVRHAASSSWGRSSWGSARGRWRAWKRTRHRAGRAKESLPFVGSRGVVAFGITEVIASVLLLERWLSLGRAARWRGRRAHPCAGHWLRRGEDGGAPASADCTVESGPGRSERPQALPRPRRCLQSEASRLAVEGVRLPRPNETMALGCAAPASSEMTWMNNRRQSQPGSFAEGLGERRALVTTPSSSFKTDGVPSRARSGNRSAKGT